MSCETSKTKFLLIHQYCGSEDRPDQSRSKAFFATDWGPALLNMRIQAHCREGLQVCKIVLRVAFGSAVQHSESFKKPRYSHPASVSTGP